MKKQAKIPYQKLKVGFELPRADYKLKPAMVAAYLKAVKESDEIYCDSKLVPPMAVAAYAMTAISDSVILPPGVIHTNGEIEFRGRVTVGDTISCYGRVSHQLKRGDIHLLTIDFSIRNQKGSAVITGKTSFVLPENGDREHPI
jgi:hypothetical protein